jgi:hypothetical protein
VNVLDRYRWSVGWVTLSMAVAVIIEIVRGIS